MKEIKTFMEGLTSQGSNNINDFELKEDEYIKDNAIYCKKCNTRRTTIVEVFENKRIVRCICNCQNEELKQQKEKEEMQQKWLRLAKLRELSLMGEKYKSTTFETTNITHNKSFASALARCKKYCDNYEEVISKGYGLYIVGNPGVGKTHLTSCMANELMNKYGKEVLFTNFFEISKAIRKTFSSNKNETEKDIINRIIYTDFLFIDDLGTESLAKNDGDNFLQDKIFEVINARYNNNKPTIFTSNNTMKELITERNFAPKTVDRIAEMSTVVLKIDGESYRGKIKNDILPF